MREAVLAKFSQNDELRVLLLGTGTAIPIEHTERDSYWAMAATAAAAIASARF